ncbi:carcinoembryonic antigen-related cell adhesion molecule 3-like [Chanodichthys erythropterus]|uniref:carcinoembryonic antigen-related cell adhesion molecule 3-like n=1 Tax=Chanodichthys erythropterus TaxID=933992 RepID=UPI00351E5917
MLILKRNVHVIVLLSIGRLADTFTSNIVGTTPPSEEQNAFLNQIFIHFLRGKVVKMKYLFNLLVIIFSIDNGASGVDTDEVSVKEGDSVTLHTGVQTNQREDIKWYFNDTLIAKINKDLSSICTDVQCNNEGTERFRDRLKLDHQTGSLNITNTRNTDSGEYKLKIFSKSNDSEKIFNTVIISSVSGVDTVSVKEGDIVTLYADVKPNQQEKIQWYFKDICVAEITGDQSKICTDVQCDERFRDRLKLDHQTGSLTITNITNTDSGEYKLKIFNSSKISEKTFSVSVHGVPALEVKTKSVKEGESISLDPDVIKHPNDLIKWHFNDIYFTKITGGPSNICTEELFEKKNSGFRDRLKLDHQTGSLNITNTKTTDSGEYHVEISSSSSSFCIGSIRSFSLTVIGVSCVETVVSVMEGDSVSVMEGDSVTLHTGVKTNQKEVIEWYFNDSLIAQINEDLSFICTDVQCDERFRDRLKLDHQTGSLTITNIRNTESGLYELEINDRTQTFSVTVHGKSFGVGSDVESVMEGDSVTLHTGVKTNQQEDIKWYFNDIRIAEISGDLSYSCTDVQCNEGTERFRDRLKLDHQTGSLIIMDIRTTDSGLYELKIISSRISGKIFNVTVHGVSAAEQDEVKRKSVKEGESVTLDPGVIKKQNYLMLWYFNDTLISEISDLRYNCTDVQCKDGDERFRDRLKLDNQTGSLTITNITNTHSGLYVLKIIIIINSSFSITRVKRFSVTVIDSGLSSGVKAGIVVGVLLLMTAAVAVIYYRHKMYTPVQQNEDDVDNQNDIPLRDMGRP